MPPLPFAFLGSAQPTNFSHSVRLIFKPSPGSSPDRYIVSSLHRIVLGLLHFYSGSFTNTTSRNPTLSLFLGLRYHSHIPPRVQNRFSITVRAKPLVRETAADTSTPIHYAVAGWRRKSRTSNERLHAQSSPPSPQHSLTSHTPQESNLKSPRISLSLRTRGEKPKDSTLDSSACGGKVSFGLYPPVLTSYDTPFSQPPILHLNHDPSSSIRLT